MKITELRDWAAAIYGAHSHKEGQVLAALGPLEEWIGHLARQGIGLELVPVGGFVERLDTGKSAPHGADEPPQAVNAGAVGGEVDPVEVFEVAPVEPPQANPAEAKPPREHFVGTETVPRYAEGSVEAPSDLALPGTSAEI